MVFHPVISYELWEAAALLIIYLQVLSLEPSLSLKFIDKYERSNALAPADNAGNISACAGDD